MDEELHKIISIDNDGNHVINEAIKKKYVALRVVFGCLRVFAYINLIIGLIISISLAGSLGEYGVFITLVGIIATVLSTIIMLAICEGICVFLDIEENTRQIILINREILTYWMLNINK